MTNALARIELDRIRAGLLTIRIDLFAGKTGGILRIRLIESVGDHRERGALIRRVAQLDVCDIASRCAESSAAGVAAKTSSATPARSK